MARKVSIDIVVDADQVNRGFKSVARGAEGLNTSIGHLRIGFAALAKSTVVIYAVEKAMEALTGAVHSGISEFKETTQIQAQTASVLKSTGEVANITAGQVHGLSLELSNLSGLSDEAIQASENVLLSFTNIRNFAGKNNDVFTQATKAVVDYSARTGKDASTAALIFGRALEDPAEKVAALSRAGIVFTKQQRDQIKAIQNTKGVLEAQKLLIRGLELRYEGAAAAAGKTLPGALEILKERFRDLAGEGIAKVAGPLRGAAVALSQFVVALTEAHGARAKLDVFVKGIDTLGRDIFDAVRKQVEGINFSAIGTVVGDKLASVDWRAQIERAAKALSRGVIVLLQRLREAINSVDWKKVGGYIAVGIEAAVAAVADFLAHVNWGAVAKQTFLLLVAAFKASQDLFLGIGEAIGKQIIAGIEAGLKAAGRAAEKLAVEIVLKIIEPFTHLPDKLGGGPFQRMKAEFQQTLNDMEAASANAAAVINTNLSATQGLGPHHAPATAPGKTTQGGTRTPAAGTGLPVPPAPTVSLPARTGITASQRNTFFDNPIARILLRGGLGSLKQQLAALQEASRLISQRIAVTRDITRKLNLEDQLLQLAAQEKDIRKQLREAFVESVTAKEFKQLGFSPTGDDLVPGVKNLKKRLGTISAAVQGTFLDTPKLETLLKKIRKVLSENLVPTEIRSKIKEMFDTIRDELKNGSGNLTKFAHTNSAAILAGLGLSPEQIRVLRSRIAQIGPGGTVPGAATPAFAFAGANTVVMHNPQFHGVTDVREFKNQLAKETGRRSGSRRGPYAGRH
jgi:hypothetical protein